MNEPVLEMEGVHGYYGNSHVLFGIDLELVEGEIVTLLGRNGAGKTTTLRSIVRVVEPRQGTVRLDGKDLGGLSTDDIADHGVRMVPEDRRVFPTLTVEENLSVAKRLAEESTVTIEDIYDQFPRLSDLRDSQGKNLSGGEQQMVAVARALIQDPRVLLLDEPSEGLAPVIVDDLQSVLSSALDAGVTVLMTEQNVRFAFDIAERGYIIDRGEIVFEGQVEEIRSRESLLKKYLSVSSEELQS